jgi:hypothetical protein
VRWSSRNTSLWTQDLAERRRKVCRVFNAAKKSGNWTDYRRSVTDYNNALRQAKRESWRRHCEEIEKCQTPEDSLKGWGRVQLALSSLETENIPK